MRFVYQDKNDAASKTIDLEPRKLRNYILIGIVALVVIIAIATSWYTVDEKEQAVVTTFGKVSTVSNAGFHFKAPFGIQQVKKVQVNVYQKIELGYRTVSDSNAQYEVIQKESKMITGDYNIVNVEFFVEYKISDPVKYLYSSYEPQLVLKNLVQSQVRNVIGSAQVDSVLTTGRNEIQQKARDLITEVLQDYDIGVVLTDLKIQDSEPPTLEVIEAFKAVETAKQQAETVINEAKAYQNSELPKAEAQEDKLLQEAQYKRQQRINEALQQVELFNARYSEYSKNPNITRSRMYYEALKEILPDVKLIIDASDGGTTKFLPLDDFINITGNDTGN